MVRCLIHPVTSTAKWAAFVQRLIRIRSQTHHYSIRCAIPRNRITRPIFFDDTPTSGRYYEVIIGPFIGDINEDKTAGCYLKEDSAAAQTASILLLRNVFRDRMISKYIRPPRSLLHLLIIICVDQWKAQSTTMVFNLEYANISYEVFKLEILINTK
jgi:hypothetical protein